MSKGENVLTEIRNNVSSFVGREVMVKANRGRRKSLEKEGILERTHQNIFVIKIKEHQQIRRISYSYADILTDSVEIKLKNDNRKIGVI
ncbi:MAG TPA: Veg family protein [Halanaerobiales bacterium]|nr:Veg family protein [Halanaerobiales bacterium]HPZ62108.1 Veg family protein [Halanaerobiales bacterium]HQD03395.1 Veg family protein [Halanaerobiales bacterium]